MGPVGRIVSAVTLLAVLAPGIAHADHVSSHPVISARVVELRDTTARVEVVWSVGCQVRGQEAGDRSTSVDSIDLVEEATGERIFLGGSFGPSSDTEVVSVARRVNDRVLNPLIKARCNADGHESSPTELRGEAFLVPGRGSGGGGGGGGGGSGSGGGDDGSGGGAGTRPCDVVKRGTPRANTLLGSPASDRLLGLAGNDVLRGRAGNDCLDGGRGRDRLYGEDGGDLLVGGAGPDLLAGGRGANAYDAGRGRDIVLARNDVAELVRCGAGRDSAVIDRADTPVRCERVRRG